MLMIVAMMVSCNPKDEDENNNFGGNGNNGGGSDGEIAGEIAGHGYVDLGLPSGLKWATCNIGAESPEDYGYYFAWGEVEPDSSYNWPDYKWCKGKQKTFTKYCTCRDEGTVDNKTVLEDADDAAVVNWGGSWRMPTEEEMRELVDNCTWTWTSQNGVAGSLATGPNGNSIFFPVGGYKLFDRLEGAESGFYYSKSLQILSIY